jgi:hypothetical protein
LVASITPSVIFVLVCHILVLFDRIIAKDAKAVLETSVARYVADPILLREAVLNSFRNDPGATGL